MQSDVNFPLVLCKPTSQIIQPKINQCKRFVLHPHFPFIYLTISILGSSTIFGLSLKYTLRFVPSILAAKVQTNFCNLFANMEKSNNQDVKEGKISPWRRMRNILIPISCLLNATDNRTRQRLPKGWRDACKHWYCIEIQVLDRDRRR